jgi:hypothetical protein
MSLGQTFAEYFKPEIQKRGREDFLKGLTFISTSSDTQVQGFVRRTPPLKVAFRSDSIASPTFTATCSCSAAARGSYCKHMWAMLLAVEKKHPDFLDSKTAIEKNQRNFERPKPKMSPTAEARAADYKEKQAQFKKQQYEKQKSWAKENRRLKKEKNNKAEGSQSRVKYSPPVEQALDFFKKHGFGMEDLPSQEVLRLARKHLSRIFHPDKGGTHDEAIALNQHYETLNRFITMEKK